MVLARSAKFFHSQVESAGRSCMPSLTQPGILQSTSAPSSCACEGTAENQKGHVPLATFADLGHRFEKLDLPDLALRKDATTLACQPQILPTTLDFLGVHNHWGGLKAYTRGQPPHVNLCGLDGEGNHSRPPMNAQQMNLNMLL